MVQQQRLALCSLPKFHSITTVIFVKANFIAKAFPHYFPPFTSKIDHFRYRFLNFLQLRRLCLKKTAFPLLIIRYFPAPLAIAVIVPAAIIIIEFPILRHLHPHCRYLQSWPFQSRTTSSSASQCIAFCARCRLWAGPHTKSALFVRLISALKLVDTVPPAELIGLCSTFHCYYCYYNYSNSGPVVRLTLKILLHFQKPRLSIINWHWCCYWGCCSSCSGFPRRAARPIFPDRRQTCRYLLNCYFSFTTTALEDQTHCYFGRYYY